MATRSAAATVDWQKLYTTLGLGQKTLTSLQTFRARNTTAQNRNAALKSTAPALDLSHYKSILKDQRAVQEAERVLREFKAVDYDVKKWDGLVEAFEGKAVTAAEETVTKISAEEKSLTETLSNIKDARSFDELTIDDIAKARPEVRKAVDTMIQKGKWTVPGYREKFGDFALM